MEEPTEPDALALAIFADAVHAAVPVASPDQGQPMTAKCKALVEGAGTMFEQGAASSETVGWKNASCSAGSSF